MGIALSAVHGLFTPLQDLLTWFLSPVQPQSMAPRAVLPASASACPAAARLHTGTTRATTPTTSCARQARPLRVVRVMDTDGSVSRTGQRMVISGRMADVCAELDRLAALEQTLH